MPDQPVEAELSPVQYVVILNLATLLKDHELDYPPEPTDYVPTGVHEKFLDGACQLAGRLTGLQSETAYEYALRLEV